MIIVYLPLIKDSYLLLTCSTAVILISDVVYTTYSMTTDITLNQNFVEIEHTIINTMVTSIKHSRNISNNLYGISKKKIEITFSLT